MLEFPFVVERRSANPKREISEYKYNQEISPSSEAINALRGVVSEPVKTVSRKPGQEGKIVEVRIAKVGPCLFGLTDWRDNKEWSDINNHIFLSTRGLNHFGFEMASKGYLIKPQGNIDGMLNSHTGRRQWDEAGWYPDAVDKIAAENAANETEAQDLININGSKAKRSISSETLGMHITQGKISQDAFNLLVALGHGVEGFSIDPSIYDSWDFKLAIYVDHRTSQKFEPLHTRMGDFILGNFFDKNHINDELKQNIYKTTKDIIEKQKQYILGRTSNEFSLEEADQAIEILGANIDSDRLPRKELTKLILNDATTEAKLIKVGINPEDLTEEKVPMPAWEHNLRIQYIQAAEKSISGRINELKGKSGNATEFYKMLNQDFPTTSWWGKYVGEMYLK